MTPRLSASHLVHTKLNRPRIAVELVERHRLYAMLDVNRPLTVVTAPAGYGKTTLVSGWVEASQRRCAWISLDAHDSHPGLFIQYLYAALEQVLPPAAYARISAPGVGAPGPLAATARQLADVLEQVEEHFILVLDDYHTISEPAIHLFLAQLLRYPPHCLRLVIASRVDPPLPLAALRALNQLTEIRTRDLRFTDRETAEYLAHELDRALDPETLDLLMESTEGWIAGLHLATLLLRNKDAGSTAALVQRHRRLAIDYLTAEVFAEQPPDVQSFLLRTSILQRMCPALCDAILHAMKLPPARQIIEHLATLDLFIVALDDEQQWFRYHHLFQRLLRHMLDDSVSPGEIAALHRAASRWCGEHGFIDEAVSYALAGGDIEHAARLIEQHRHAAMNGENWQQLARWLHLLPPAVVSTDPRFALLEAWVLHKYQRLADLLERLDLAQALLDASTLPPETRSAQRGEIDALRSQYFYLSGEPRRAQEMARRALKNLPLQCASGRGLAWLFLAGSTFQLDGLQPAFSLLEAAWTEDPARRTAVASRILIVTCFLYWQAADMLNLKDVAEELLQLAVRNDWGESRLWAHYFRGSARYELNELDAAIDDFREVVNQRHAAAGYTYVYSSFGLAAALQAQGNLQAATAAAAAVLEQMPQTSDQDLRRTVTIFQALLTMRQGVPQDVDLTCPAGSDRALALPMPGFFETEVARVDLLVRKGTPACLAEAKRRVGLLENRLAADHNDRFLIDILVIKALLCAAQGQQSDALAALQQALALAQRGGLLRVFLDAAPALDPLLKTLQLAGPQESFRQYIRRERARSHAGTERANKPAAVANPALMQPRHPDLIELLTQRELEVLQLLALRMTNKEIARALAISTGTVKQHTRSVFQKLHAGNRRDAIVQARSMGFQFNATYPT